MNSPEPKSSARVDPNLGSVIAGKYKILNKIGEGGMGSVYIAEQEPINRKVAIKVLLGKLAEDEVSVRRFEQEARAISRMQHPNTVTIYDFGKTDDDRLYIVMEFLKGRTLTHVLRDHGVLHPGRACKIMRQVCSSLADAHAAGIIHRDLKPDNIFLTEVGGDPDWVKVLDFGVAKLANEGAGTLTQTGMIFGTPKYMSPEQAEGRPVDVRSDIYALGVILYELLIGRPPFIADTPVALLLKHISEPPAPFAKVRPDIQADPRIEAVVMKALEKNADRRHQSVIELANDLTFLERNVSGPMPTHATGTAPMPVSGAFPTEMVPGASPPMTASNLLPPSQVPSNLSLSVPAGVQSPGVPTGAITQQGQLPPSMAFSGMPSSFAGAPTLGNAPEQSGRLRAPQRPLVLVAGASLVMACVFAAVLIMQRNNGVASEPLVTREAAAVPASEPTPAQQPQPQPKPEAVVESATLGSDPHPDKGKAEGPPKVPGPAKPDRPRLADESRKDRGGARVKIVLSSAPEGADVTHDGERLGRTPVTVELPRDDVVTLTFAKEGYASHQEVVSTSSSKKILARLDRIGRGSETAPPLEKSPVVTRTEPKIEPKTPPPDPGDSTQGKVDDLK